MERKEPIEKLDINGIMKLIPHRFPILMVDKADIIEEGKLIIGYKSVSGNENFFQGHFPGQPIMPGVLIVEALAQCSCILIMRQPHIAGKLAFFMGIDNVKFRKPVVPGDQLELHVEILRLDKRIGKAHGEAFVNGEKATQADFTCVIVPRDNAEASK